MSDLANLAAATAAGYKAIQTDRGAGQVPRFTTTLELQTAGFPDQAFAEIRAIGTDQSSQGNADTAAVAALNAQRRIRYAAGSTAHDGKGRSVSFDSN